VAVRYSSQTIIPIASKLPDKYSFALLILSSLERFYSFFVFKAFESKRRTASGCQVFFIL